MSFESGYYLTCPAPTRLWDDLDHLPTSGRLPRYSSTLSLSTVLGCSIANTFNRRRHCLVLFWFFLSFCCNRSPFFLCNSGRKQSLDLSGPIGLGWIEISIWFSSWVVDFWRFRWPDHFSPRSPTYSPSSISYYRNRDGCCCFCNSLVARISFSFTTSSF